MQRVTKGHNKPHHSWYYDMIALKQGNKNPQNNMIASFSFTSTSKCNSMFKSFTSAGRDFESTVKLTPRQAKNTANDWTRFRHKAVDFTRFSLFSRKLQTAVGSLLRMEVFLPKP